MKLLLLYDVPGWAWHFKAKAIQKYLKNDFEQIDIMRSNTVKNNKWIFKKYNHIHWFGWIEGRLWCQRYKGTSSGISSHNYLLKHFDLAKSVIPKYGAITCTSKILYNELKGKKLNKHIYYCPNGVREDLFTPGEKTRNNNKFVVFWCGQPTTGGFRGCQLDAHGYEHIVLPLEKLLKNHSDIHFEIMGKTFKNAIGFDQMPDMYRNCDLYLHTGTITGTPNTAFEAQSCGKPVISTAIGAIPELIKDGYNGWKVPRVFCEKGAKARVNDIYKLILKAKEMDLIEIGQNARKTIEESWTWKDRAQNWKKVFLNHGKKL